MSLTIGMQIKGLRQKKGVTQEALAAAVGVSPQAVSKWENAVTAPDIELLPGLAVYFGVKIDELFQIPKEKQYERIRNIRWGDKEASQEEFNSIVQYLKDMPNRDWKRIRTAGSFMPT